MTLSLTFRLPTSSAGGNGILGIGWDLNIGYIELNRRNGLPAVGNADSYDFNIAGLSGELYNDGTGVYRQNYETVYREFRKLSNGGWEMRDGQGNRYTFGSSSYSSISGQLWMLDSVTDPVGNDIQYAYLNDRNSFYPSAIFYTGFQGSAGSNSRYFDYESRPDWTVTLVHGLPEYHLQRLKDITVYAGAQSTLARRYDLHYEQDPLTGISELSQIILTGADGTSTIPLRTMQYTTANEGWSGGQLASAKLPEPLVIGGGDTGDRLVDVNGDGCADEITAVNDFSSSTTVYLRDCQGNFTASAAWTQALPYGTYQQLNAGAPGVPVVDAKGNDNGVRFLDVNGDSRPDILIANGNKTEVWLNTYNGHDPATIGWVKAANWVFPASESSYDPATGQPNCSNATTTPFQFQMEWSGTDSNGNATPGASTGVYFTDVNGDGLPDIVWSLKDSNTGTCISAVYLNNGSGWVRNNTLSTNLKSIGNFFIVDTLPTGYDLVDVNGDGRADIVQTKQQFYQQVFLFNGASWQQDVTFSASLAQAGILSLDGNNFSTGFQFVDFNRDGLVDIVISKQGNPVKAYRNTGTSWVEELAVENDLSELPNFMGTVALNNYPTQTAVLADINGDGVLDLIDMTHVGTGTIYLGGTCGADCFTNTHRVLPGNLLQGSVGPLGELVDIEYDRAPEGLPIPLFVPTLLSRTDRLSSTQVYSYDYLHGAMGDRRFLGFEQVTETEPNGTRVLSGFDQSALFLGAQRWQITQDTLGQVRTEKVSTRQPVTPQLNPAFQQGVLVSTDETHTDYTSSGTPVSYSSLVEMSYDDRLNLTRVYKNPNTAVPGSDLTTTFAWVRNDDAAIWNLPWGVTVYSGNSPSAATLVNNTVIYYDNQGIEATSGLATETDELVQLTPAVKYAIRNMSYDQFGNIVSVTDRNGNQSNFTYDTATSTYRVNATDQEGRTIASSFDARFGAVLSDTDPSGNVTTYTYDPFGRPQTITKPGDAGLANGTTTYSYSPLPPAPGGFYVLRSDSTSNGGTLNSAEFYDAFGQVIQTESNGPNGKTIVVTTDYDDTSQPIRVSRPHFLGDPVNSTTIARDDLHRVVQITDADGLFSTRSYAGLQITETDRRGVKTLTTMNPGQQVTRKDLTNGASVASTLYNYDVNNPLTQVIRADGSTTTVTYDSLGRKIRMDDPNTGAFQYQYDGEGHMTAVTGPDGNTIEYAYDKTGDLIRKIYPDGTANTITYGVTGQTNAVGRPVSVTDAAGTIRFTYDVRGRVIQRSRTVAANGKTYVTRYAFDSGDRLVSLTYPDGYVVNYTYDGGGNVLNVTDSTGRTVAGNMAYSASGRMLGLQYGNSTSSAYANDALDRMTILTTIGTTGKRIQNLSYSYDADSNITAIQDAAYQDNQQFNYDSMNRLTSALGSYGREAYTYDAIGNLLTKGNLNFVIDPLHPERATCMLAGKAGLNSNPAAACAQTGLTGITAIGYDGRGNVVQKGNLGFEYDFDSRMVAETRGGSTIEQNTYDFWGDRVVQKTAEETRIFIDGVYEEGASTVTHHIKTSNLLLATIVAPRKSATLISSMTVPTSMTTMQSLTSEKTGPALFIGSVMGASLLMMLGSGLILCRGTGPNLRVYWGFTGMLRQLCMRPVTSSLVLALIFSMISSASADAWAAPPPAPALIATTTTTYTTTTTTGTSMPQQRFYYRMNHLGGTNLITDDTGKIVARREYKPYGEMYDNEGESEGNSDTPFGFDGQRMDGAGSLYYFNARFYDPQMGRFLSADSEVHNLTTPQALHRYAFAGGNPVRYVDPSGHAWYDFLIAAVVILVVVTAAVLTGGMAGLALAGGGALLGFGIGAAVAGGLHMDSSSQSFWEVAVTGAVVGACIGGGIGAFMSEGAAAADAESAAEASENLSELDAEEPEEATTVNSYTNTSNALKSMAFGGPQSILTHELQGGGTDGLLRNTVIDVGFSAASGVVAGKLMSGAKAGAGSIWSRLTTGSWEYVSETTVKGFAGGVVRTILIQGGLYTFAGLEHESAGTYISSNRSTEYGGIVDASVWIADPLSDALSVNNN